MTLAANASSITELMHMARSLVEWDWEGGEQAPPLLPETLSKNAAALPQTLSGALQRDGRRGGEGRGRESRVPARCPLAKHCTYFNSETV